MKVRTVTFGVVIAAFTLASAAPALAQNPKVGDPGGGSGSGARSNPGSSGGGETAVARGGSSGGGATTSAGGDATTSSGGSSTSSAGVNSPSTSFGSFSGVREAAPSHRFSDRSGARLSDGQKATPRSAGAGSSSSGSSGTATPRSTAAPSSSGSSNPSSGGGSGARSRATAPDASNNASGAREVPSWSRPRGDQPVTGTAVTRVGPPPNHNGYYGSGYYYDPAFYYNGYYGCGYGCGYGYGFGYGYSPFYAPYGFGLGYGLYSGLGWNPYFGDPFGGDPYSAGYGGYSSSRYYQEQGNLKLKVKPRDAKVYVDGYFVGPVDEFDGSFQKLALNGGRHKVEIKADGYETAEFDVLISPDKTVTFQGELKRIQ
jgi:PEGA domain-containing protein